MLDVREIDLKYNLRNSLTINSNKCDRVYVSNKIKKSFSLDDYPHLKLGLSNLRISHEIKFLGVFINDTLNWHSHLRRLRLRINGMINTLRRAGSCLSVETHNSVKCWVFKETFFTKPRSRSK